MSMDSQDSYSKFTIGITDIISSYNSSNSNTENLSDSNSKFYDEYADVFMAITATSSTRQEPINESPEEIDSPLRDNPSKPNSGPWFSIDDLPPNQWRTNSLRTHIPTKL
ncbi:hypothetical protein V8G54_006683 [Vigna mungo]|uniref:Uncharacterized protein n=1 Tax=Vigna mungo TaxID=3915 RepID=A0AAQ3NZF9_VIGMU